jgi:hypothetical protein
MSDSRSSGISETYLKQIQLPSRGLFYGDKVPDGLVTVIPMGTEQEKLFAARRDGSAIISKIIEDCLTAPIPHLELLTGDLTWVLLNIRAVSKGSNYEYSFSCGNCGTKSLQKVDLLDLPIKGPPEGFNLESDYPFSVQLPMLGKTLGIRLMTGKDQDAVDRYRQQVARHNPSNADEAAYMYKFARRIALIDGVKPGIQEALRFVPTIRGQDLQAIYDTIEDNEIGPDIEVTPKCQACGYVNDPEDLPVRDSFFHPTKRRRSSNGDYIRAAVALDENS